MDERGSQAKWAWALAALPLLLAWRAVRRRRERQAAAALAKWREEQQLKGKVKKRTGKAKKKGGGASGKGAAYRKRLMRFLLLTAAQELISRQRNKMKESLPQSRLVKRISTTGEQEG